MPNEDEKFEAYLKRFRPLMPDPLPMQQTAKVSRRTWTVRAWIAATAATVALVLLVQRHKARVRDLSPSQNVSSFVADLPLTVGTANALLATAPSYKAFIDDLAFRSANSEIPKGKESALTVLSKEKIKL